MKKYPITTMKGLRSEGHRELTPEEEEKSYSKYFYKPLADIPEEDLNILNAGPSDPILALKIEDRDDLLLPGYLPIETGYCKLPDGSAFAATKVNFPGATPEMFDWWFNWHPIEPLRYALWSPNAHMSISAKYPDAHRDTSGYPLKSRNYGKVHYPVEGFRYDMAKPAVIQFFSPEDFGLNKNLLAVTPVKSMFLANLYIMGGSASFTDDREEKVEDDSIRTPFNVFFHSVRTVEGGCELRSRYWIGKNIVDGKAVHVDMPEGLDTEQFAWENCRHSLTEYNNLASFLPQLYREQGGKIN
ncbi:MAG: hypothetical protein LUD01_03960 [Clostridiales bacterium]|nr:hypothetical protein [Clostridiales bacterium]